MTEKEAYIAFSLADKVGPVAVAKGISKFGSVVEAWNNAPSLTNWDGNAINYEREIEKASKLGVTILTPADEAYPKALREHAFAPLALYVKGDVSALSNLFVAIVGTRRATPYGKDCAYTIAAGLASMGVGIVSGLALGIDAEAHNGALSVNGLTVGVIGSGLDEFYPTENIPIARKIVETGGAVISQFPLGRRPDQKTFPRRNKIVAALAKGVVVAETPIVGGAMMTASLAADMGKVVMAVPGRVDSRSSAGCLSLIRDGARLVRSAEDVKEEITDLFPGEITKPSAKKKSPSLSVKIDDDESHLLNFVDREGVSVDYLVRKTGFSAAKVNTLTMTLMIKGLVRFFPGNRVALPRSE
jgi:DNA processing protein